MADVHYFQRYSQRENVVTNNTLLLLSRLNQEEPKIFEQYVASLLEDLQRDDLEDFICGPKFAQQEGGGASVPDGTIRQAPFQIAIETKLGHDFSGQQLASHSEALDGDGLRILLALGKTRPSEERQEGLREQVRNHEGLRDPDDVLLVFTSFRRLVADLKDQVPLHRHKLSEIVDDFEQFCETERLLPAGSWRMRAVAVGKSHPQNREYGVYFQPAERGYRDHQWIGLYWSKAIRHIGKVAAVVTGTISEDGEFIVEGVEHPLKSKGLGHVPELTSDQVGRILGIHEAVQEQHGWDLSRGSRFFILEKAEDLKYTKESPYGILSSKYFDLRSEVGEGVGESTSVAEVVGALDGQSWE